MITQSNYFDHVSKIGVNKLPEALKVGHEVVEEATEKGQNWRTGDKDIDELIDLQLEKFGEFLANSTAHTVVTTKPAVTVRTAKKAVATGKPKTAATPKKKVLATTTKKAVTTRSAANEPKPATRIKKMSLELITIKSYMALAGKKVSSLSIQRRATKLQNEITQGKVTDHNSLISEISKTYTRVAATLKQKPEIKQVDVVITKEFIDKCKKAIAEAKPKLVVEYLAGTGKKPVGVASAKTTYKPQATESKPAVRKKQNVVLSGVSSAAEILAFTYPSIDLGPYAKYFGNVARNFDMIVWSRPKVGKSYFLLGFANYLAKNHGKVAYVTVEEYGARTLKDQIEKTGATDPNITYAQDLSLIDPAKFDFIFFDSINALRMNISSYKEFRRKYPHLGCVLILQVTKEGNFKGDQDWEHEVEINVKISKEINEDTGVEERILDVYQTRYDKFGKHVI